MATVLVRNLDEQVVVRLKKRAAANNRSLEGELRVVLIAASEDRSAIRRSAFRAMSEELRSQTRGSAQSPSEDLIRQDRDSNHGM